MVKPDVVYGSATWAMTETVMKTLNTWDRNVSRRIYGPVVEQGM